MADAPPDYYAILGVPKSASADDIKVRMQLRQAPRGVAVRWRGAGVDTLRREISRFHSAVGPAPCRSCTAAMRQVPMPRGRHTRERLVAF